MRTLIKNGTVVTASDTTRADVLVEDGKIAALRAPADSGIAADTTIDATGKYVLPGGIDAHTHLDMPFGGTVTADDFESGTLAAAFGGTTTIIDFAIQSRGQALRQGLDAWHAKAEGKAAIDYGFHMIVTDVPPSVLDEMAGIVREGVTSFKLFTAYPGALLLDDGSIFRTMLRAGELGALVAFHAEAGLAIDVLVERARAQGNLAPKFHGLTRPSIAEGEATNRAIALAAMAKVPCYIVHLTCVDALERVMAWRDKGVPVFAETCPQYLFCSDEDLARPGFEGAKFVCSPPMRPSFHQEHLWAALRRDDLQVVSTDHCSFHMKGQKDMGKDDFSKIPNGMPGIETRLHLMHDGGVRAGKISLNRFVEITATAPAKLFGLYPRKGTIAIGADADLVVWDPEARLTLSTKTLHTRVDYTPFEGRQVVGRPTHVLSRGKLVVEGDRYLGKKGDGQFVRRSTFSQ
jgi:dihydropyrimidinase